MSNEIVHLHNHGQYSILDGLSSYEELVVAAKDLGQTAVAVTDHGTLSGHRELQKSCKEHGLKPIFGCEMYLSPTDRFDKSSSKDKSVNAYNHLIVLAKTQQGLTNLNKLSEIAYTEGFYNKPRIDKEILTQYAEGLIVLSGCRGGVIAKAVEAEKWDIAQEWTSYFKTTFGEDFYMELQPDNPTNINLGLLEVAAQFGVTPTATADTHFPREKDRALEECMLILSSSPKRDRDFDYNNTQGLDVFERLNKLYPNRTLTFEHLDLYIQSITPMKDKFDKQGITTNILYESTLEIANKVEDIGYASGLDLLPKPKTNSKTTLRRLVFQGLKDRGLENDPEHVARCEFELSVIGDKEFDPYFLMVYDMVDWAKSKGIKIGPGRGSACGSDVCYALKITDVDPLKYNLLFFRFIDPNRPDWPDIDIDIQDDRRQEVIDYLKKKFTHVAGISIYTRFSQKGLVRDVARVFAVPLADVNKVLKGVHKFEDFENDHNVKWFHDKYPEVLEYAQQLRGRIRSVGIHASGIVVSKEPIENHAPIETREDKDNKVSGRIAIVGLDMKAVADVGLIKIDDLGLKTLSVMDQAIKQIKERHGVEIVEADIPLDDIVVYKDLSEGKTVGVFQAEATPYTKLLKSMQPNTFDDLILSNALVRPGAANTVGPMVIARMHGEEPVTYLHDILKPITLTSYGLIVFQEDIMLTCTELAGMSMADASAVRSIIGKKKDVKEFEAYKDRFIDGAVKNVSKKVADKLWHDFEAFAEYGFNRSHSTGYSLMTYWTAWLKHYYPTEYMYALLSKEDKVDKTTTYLLECKRLGIRIVLPHVNTSGESFTLDDDAILFGIGNIKNWADVTASRIVSKRPFKNYEHLVQTFAVKNSGINSRGLNALNMIGAAAFDDNPRRGDESDYYWEYLNIPKFKNSHVPDHIQSKINDIEDYDEESFMVFMAMPSKVKRGQGWSRVEFVDETGRVGLFDKEESEISMGQMYLIGALGNKIVTYISIDDLIEHLDNPQSAFEKYLVDDMKIPEGQFYILSFQRKLTKQKKIMGYLTVVDSDGEVGTILCFSKMFPKVHSNATEGSIVTLSVTELKDGGYCVNDIIL